MTPPNRRNIRRSPAARQSPAARLDSPPTLLVVLGFMFAWWTNLPCVSAQITATRPLSGVTPVATLDEQLINRLHATTDAQAAYIRYVVKLTDEEKLEKRLVLAIERYALRRNPRYAFPYFERALRYEAAKRGVALTSIRHFQSTADPLR